MNEFTLYSNPVSRTMTPNQSELLDICKMLLLDGERFRSQAFVSFFFMMNYGNSRSSDYLPNSS
jgi:hypothetical protein